MAPSTPTSSQNVQHATVPLNLLDVAKSMRQNRIDAAKREIEQVASKYRLRIVELKLGSLMDEVS